MGQISLPSFSPGDSYLSLRALLTYSLLQEAFLNPCHFGKGAPTVCNSLLYFPHNGMDYTVEGFSFPCWSWPPSRWGSSLGTQLVRGQHMQVEWMGDTGLSGKSCHLWGLLPDTGYLKCSALVVAQPLVAKPLHCYTLRPKRSRWRSGTLKAPEKARSLWARTIHSLAHVYLALLLSTQVYGV